MQAHAKSGRKIARMYGARCTKYQLEPAPSPSVAITCVSGSPSAFAKAMASATADDAGTQDLIGGLGGLAAPFGPRVPTVLPRRRESGARSSRRPLRRRP